MDIGTGVSTIQIAIDLAKGLKATKSLMDNAEVNMKIIELVSALVDAKEENVEYRNRILNLEQQIEELKEKLEIKEKVDYEEPFYWIDLGNGKKDGAFCQRCYDAETKLSRLINNPLLNKGTHHCSVCDTWYGKRMDPQAEINKAFNNVYGKQ